MDNWLFVDIVDPRSIIADRNGELWLPLTESPNLSERTETVNCGGVYFDVIGFSEARESLLLSPIVIEGSADNIEQELAEHIGQS